MCLAREWRENSGNAAAYRRRDRLQIHTLDETIDDAQFDPCALFEFLREDDYPHQRIAGAHINLLKLVGKLKQVSDADALADQWRGNLFPRRGEFGKLARDRKTKQRETERPGLRGYLCAGGHLRQRNPPAVGRGRDDRRSDLARRRRGLGKRARAQRPSCRDTEPE